MRWCSLTKLFGEENDKPATHYYRYHFAKQHLRYVQKLCNLTPSYLYMINLILVICNSNTGHENLKSYQCNLPRKLFSKTCLEVSAAVTGLGTSAAGLVWDGVIEGRLVFDLPAFDNKSLIIFGFPKIKYGVTCNNKSPNRITPQYCNCVSLPYILDNSPSLSKDINVEPWFEVFGRLGFTLK